MVELSDARADLARLQCRELELLQGLLAVRKAVAAQKVVIDELIKASAVPPINRLPNELLAQIFLLIRGNAQTLASVSHRWRVVIMGTPSIWTRIWLDQYRSRPTLLKLHLDRSGQLPLTVSLDSYLPELKVVLPHASRIQTLKISSSASVVLSKFASLAFPSLENLRVRLESNSVNLLSTLCSRSPALKCLTLLGLDKPSLAASLTTGLLGNSTPQSTWRIIPAESLTSLSLTGIADSWDFLRDSIHFPILESLELNIIDPMSFLEAIVAPKLECFEFSKPRGTRLVSRRFSGPASKFDNVYRLTFAPVSAEKVDRDALYMAKDFCEVFRGVRHANIHITYLLSPNFSYWALVPHDKHQVPVDNWTRLETLEIQDFTFIRPESRRHFVDWITKRRTSGRQKLHLKLVSDDAAYNYLTIRETSNAYQALQQCCASVELCHIPASSRMCLSTSAGSLLLSIPVHGPGSAGQTNLGAPAGTCSDETAEALLAQLWTL
ncbi:hypothetical protein BKA83DRAFT_4223873 [Pisolithus microcarpus]|nr:hypothetical protein BKA83DRAFT_4223873 [Pisolithus microcarpus]